MTAICYSSSLSAVPTNEQLLGEKRKCAKFQSDISKDKFEYIQTDGHEQSTQLVMLIIYIIYIYILFRVSHFVANLIPSDNVTYSSDLALKKFLTLVLAVAN